MGTQRFLIPFLQKVTTIARKLSLLRLLCSQRSQQFCGLFVDSAFLRADVKAVEELLLCCEIILIGSCEFCLFQALACGIQEFSLLQAC